MYQGKKYQYVQCGDCSSIYTDPMPDEAALASMYGADYEQFLTVEEAHSGRQGTERVLKRLKSKKAGNFLDYGCGGGSLLTGASKLGWKCYGVDFDRPATDTLATSGSLTVLRTLDELPYEITFDVIHMGDVIEHLTDVNQQIPQILERLKPGGELIAQGPLEANFNLFLLGLKLKKFLRPSDSDMPPYHVSLATLKGQTLFFKRVGLDKIELSIFETSHPAPETLGSRELRSPRLTSLFLLRKTSQIISAIFPTRMGNRYFYIGRKIA